MPAPRPTTRLLLAGGVAALALAAGALVGEGSPSAEAAKGTPATAPAAAPAAAPQPASGHHVVTWGASADRVTALAGLTDQTVRNLVHTSIGGADVRVSLSNAFGDRPVTFDSIHLGVAVDSGGAALVPGSNRPVTFQGSGSVTVQPGGEVLSDPVAGRVPADTTLAVSAHVVGESGPVTGHNLAMQTSYVSGAGDVAAEESGAAYTQEVQSWLWVESLVVTAPKQVGTVAFLGDSITDGHSSTVGADRRWPDQLADRLATRPVVRQHGVMNEGISANRVLVDGLAGGTGQSALARFDRDVLSQPGVETVVVLEGINDIRWDDADEPGDLITGYRQLIARAHATGVCVVGATLTPFEAGSRYSPERDQVRTGVNAWIRSTDELDGFVDFDLATRDPLHPARFLPAYDSGDHLHPGDAGYAAMAAAFDPRLLECDR